VRWPNLVQVTRNSVAPGRIATVWHKLLARARGEYANDSRATRWCASRAASENDVAAIDSSLWEEARSFASRLEEHAEPKLRALGVEARGNGAHCALLYFLARWVQPESVLETGVASGYSSAALLAALERNGKGHLYSSDFPYLRVRNAERHIGCLVDPEVRARWTLELRGDRVNVPRLLAGAGRVDLFHYDSDKSYSGRHWVLSRVAPRLSDQAVVVMDDISDNFFFQDWLKVSGWPSLVLHFRNKYIGVASVRFAASGERAVRAPRGQDEGHKP
jgi:predicted O-methyltransferase YrrM